MGSWGCLRAAGCSDPRKVKTQNDMCQWGGTDNLIAVKELKLSHRNVGIWYIAGCLYYSESVRVPVTAAQTKDWNLPH